MSRLEHYGEGEREGEESPARCAGARTVVQRRPAVAPLAARPRRRSHRRHHFKVLHLVLAENNVRVVETWIFQHSAM